MIVREIVARVREYLDEVESLNEVEVLNGSMPVEERIIALIPECAMLYMNGRSIPENVLSSFVVQDNGVATMELPVDWGRLRELKLSCWHRSVYDTIGEGSALYQRQQNLVTRGGTVRPVVAIVPYGASHRMEMYSVPTWDSRVAVERASYVPLPTITDEASDIDIESRKEAALCYTIAVRVARTYGTATTVELLSASLNEELMKWRE